MTNWQRIVNLLGLVFHGMRNGNKCGTGGNMGKAITTHFALDEFACHSGKPYPPEWIDDRLRPLCKQLEIVRRGCGDRPMLVDCGYRDPDYNELLRKRDIERHGFTQVAKNTQHMHGRAADIAVDGMAPSDVHAICLALDASGKITIGGLGRYPGWVHIDIRERAADGHLARWGIGANDIIPRWAMERVAGI